MFLHDITSFGAVMLWENADCLLMQRAAVASASPFTRSVIVRSLGATDHPPVSGLQATGKRCFVLPLWL